MPLLLHCLVLSSAPDSNLIRIQRKGQRQLRQGGESGEHRVQRMRSNWPRLAILPMDALTILGRRRVVLKTFQLLSDAGVRNVFSVQHDIRNIGYRAVHDITAQPCRHTRQLYGVCPQLRVWSFANHDNWIFFLRVDIPHIGCVIASDGDLTQDAAIDMERLQFGCQFPQLLRCPPQHRDIPLEITLDI
jgi:hypothetical protein